MSWREGVYPLSQDGVVYVAWYSDLEAFVKTNTGAEPPRLAAFVYSPAMKSSAPLVGVGGPWLDAAQLYQRLAEVGTVYLTEWDEDGLDLRLREVGAIDRLPADAGSTPLVRYSSASDLLSADVQGVAEDAWDVTLRWTSDGPVQAEVFVHLYDAAGAIVTQADGPALGGLLPLWTWAPGDVIVDVRRLTLPPDAPAGPYRIAVGVYDAEGRYPALTGDEPAPDDAAIIAVIE
jgi:hypothetical protein